MIDNEHKREQMPKGNIFVTYIKEVFASKKIFYSLFRMHFGQVVSKTYIALMSSFLFVFKRRTAD
jgi:hypothetical protein